MLPLTSGESFLLVISFDEAWLGGKAKLTFLTLGFQKAGRATAD